MNNFINASAAKGAEYLDGKITSNDYSDVTDVTDATNLIYKDFSGNAIKEADVTSVTESKIPSKDKCPTFICFDDWIKEGETKLHDGVWYFEVDKEGQVTKTRVCSPLKIESVTYDSFDNNYGRLLRFKTTKGAWRDWAMPMELLKGSGDELRGELLAMGVQLQPGAKPRNRYPCTCNQTRQNYIFNVPCKSAGVIDLLFYPIKFMAKC